MASNAQLHMFSGSGQIFFFLSFFPPAPFTKSDCNPYTRNQHAREGNDLETCHRLCSCNSVISLARAEGVARKQRQAAELTNRRANQLALEETFKFLSHA